MLPKAPGSPTNQGVVGSNPAGRAKQIRPLHHAGAFSFLFESSGETKTGEVVPVVGGVLVARCGAGEARHGAPGPAAANTLRAIAGKPRGPDRGRARIARIPAVLGPLPDIAEHVVESQPGVRLA